MTIHKDGEKTALAVDVSEAEGGGYLPHSLHRRMVKSASGFFPVFQTRKSLTSTYRAKEWGYDTSNNYRRDSQIIVTSPLPAALLDYRLIRDDHALHYIQHGAECRNPYEKIIAKLQGLPIICIAAFGAEIDAFGHPIDYLYKDFSPLLKSGSILQEGKSIRASLPYDFVVAAAITAARFGGKNSMLTSRVTVWAQDSIPHSPKSTTTKLKTGKGGISAGVIPVDLETTTIESSSATLIGMKQNPNYRPAPDEKNITTVQWAKPLEQVLAGLQKSPPDFVKRTSDALIRQLGYMEFQMNCEDPLLNEAIYRIDLLQDQRDNSKDTVQPLSLLLSATTATPSWWCERFGHFPERVRHAYHVEYKKSAAQPLFQPYEVYACLGEDGNKLPLSGDQDIFFIPRSEKYKLGHLATEVIDTHATNGVQVLVNKMKEVHRAILLQDLLQKKISEKNLQISLDTFFQFITTSYSYIASLGMVTPYDAYFIIQLNIQVAKVREHYRNNPIGLAELAKQVTVDLSVGIQDLRPLDFDLNTAWFSEKPAEMSRRIEVNFVNGFYVAPELVARYLQYEGNCQFITLASAYYENISQKIEELKVVRNRDWQVYLKIATKKPPITLPGDEPPAPPYYQWKEIAVPEMIEFSATIDVAELMIYATVGSCAGCILITNDEVKSTFTAMQLHRLLPEIEPAEERRLSVRPG